MTICIAALSDDRKNAIICSDKLISITSSTISFECETSDAQKINFLDEDICLLCAGDTVYSYAVMDSYKKEIIKSTEITTIDMKMQLLYRCYCNFRLIKFAEINLLPRNIFSWEKYFENMDRIPQSLSNQINDEFIKFHVNFNLTLLVVVKDVDGLCSIFEISNSGISCFNCFGYICVGSGAAHAINEIIRSNYSSQNKLETVKKIVINAKKASEISSGVGRETDCRIFLPELEAKSAIEKSIVSNI